MPELIQVQPQNLLQLPDKDQLKKELGLVDPAEVVAKAEKEVDPKLVEAAREFAKKLVSINPRDVRGREAHRSSVESIGSKYMLDYRENPILTTQIREIAQQGTHGKEVGDGLISLKMNLEKFDPNRFNFGPGWIGRMLGATPIVGEKVERYVAQFLTHQTVIEAIIMSLDKGAAQLSRNNITLKDRQIKMRELTYKLADVIKYLQLLDRELEKEFTEETDEEKRKFIQEELLFALRKTILDRQQMYAVNLNGIVGHEMIIRINDELINGVSRVKTVTMSALESAVTMQVALAHAINTGEKIKEVQDFTDNLIEKTSEVAKTKGVEVYKKSAGLTLDLEKLKNSFTNFNEALDEMSRFRREAVPQMANTILELDQLTTDAEKRIKRLEEGNRARDPLVGAGDLK